MGPLKKVGKILNTKWNLLEIVKKENILKEKIKMSDQNDNCAATEQQENDKQKNVQNVCFDFQGALDQRKKILNAFASFSTGPASFSRIKEKLDAKCDGNNAAANSKCCVNVSEFMNLFTEFTTAQGEVQKLLSDFKSSGQNHSQTLESYYNEKHSKNPPFSDFQTSFTKVTDDLFKFVHENIDPLNQYLNPINEKYNFCTTLAEVKCFLDSWADVEAQAYYLVDLFFETSGSNLKRERNNQNQQSINPYHLQSFTRLLPKKIDS